MTSFDDLKSKALDLAQAGAAKAKELTDIAKLNIANSAEEDTIRKAYIDLGKLYYAERGMAPEGAYAALCEKITASKQKIEENKARSPKCGRRATSTRTSMWRPTVTAAVTWTRSRKSPPRSSPLWWSRWLTTRPRSKQSDQERRSGPGKPFPGPLF